MCPWHVRSSKPLGAPLSCYEKYNMNFKLLHLPRPRNEHKRACRDSTLSGAPRFITVALLWRAGDWAGTANMTVLSPWPRVEVMSLSEMNHSRSPEGPPGLFLKSYIIVLLRGGSAFNIVMILLSKVMYLVWIRPCIRKLLKGNSLEKLYRMWQLYEAQFRNSRGIYKWLCELGVWRAITRVPRRFANTKLSWRVNTKIWRL